MHFNRINALIPILLAATASAFEPYGINSMLQLDQLPYLSSDISAGQQSSYDRSGGNGDAGNFLYSNAGENVMLDIQGPGVVYCIWTTGFNYGSNFIKAYIDGETTPRLNMVMGNLFAGTNAPFLSPLANNDAVSSGGFYSYVPIPFSKSIRMTCSGANYYHVGYHTFMPNASVTSWSQSDNVSAVRSIWQQCSKDPKPAVTGTTAQGTVTIGAGSASTLLDISGPRQVTSIRIKIPELGTIGQSSGGTPGSVTDNGRAFTGYSQFTVAINPSNQGVRLKRRFDYGIGDQKANVSVDGATAGQWFTPGADAITRWRDSSFVLPSNLTSGKSSITVRITFVSSANDWNEFFYWVYSVRAAGGDTLTDTLDVGNAASETGHSYTITTQTWTGTQTLQYPSGVVPAPLDVLNNISLKIFWDNESTPSVDAPLGSFFAMGHFGGYPTRSLMLGADSTDYLYCFFPMPFGSHCTIQLASARATATASVAYEIIHAPFTDSINKVGYFKTKFSHEIKSGSDGIDVLFLDTVGSGKFLGVMHSMRGPNQGYLEGDERFYVDNNRSPVFHGTGTEDFYQGGWYFNKGRFTLPLHGAPVVSGTDNAAYRFLLQDAVTFRTRFRASIEHGDGNGAAVEDWAIAYYYLNPQPSAIVTDSLDVGNTSSETAHGYASSTPTFSGNRTSTFEGIADKTSITESGKALSDSSSFNLSIDSHNSGVILRRMFDQTDQKQSADVYIDNTLAGTWYHAGSNTTHKWREDEFMVPPSLSKGKSTMHISLRHSTGTPDWNEFKYWAYTLVDTLSMTSVNQKVLPDVKLMQEIGTGSYSLKVFALNGKVVRMININNQASLSNVEKNLHDLLPAGVYWYKLNSMSSMKSIKSGSIITAK